MTPHNTVDAERLRALRAQRVLRDMRGRYERLKAGDAVEALDAAIEALDARAEPQDKAERAECAHLNTVLGDDRVRWCQHCGRQLPATPPTGEDTAAAQDELLFWQTAYESVAFQLYRKMGNDNARAAECATADLESRQREFAALAQRPAAPREGVRGSGEACGRCEPDGVYTADGDGPMDCYACGKRAGTRSEDARDGEDANA